MVKILMVLGFDGFRDEEYFEPRKVLEDSGHTVVTTSKEEIAVSAIDKKEVKVDILFKDIFTKDGKSNIDEYDAIAFIGGSGARTYLEDKKAHQLSWDMYNAGKLVTAICLAPVILANAGLLIGKKATVWSGAKADLCAGHCIYNSHGVITDGRIITASGPDVAIKFGEAILSKLSELLT